MTEQVEWFLIECTAHHSPVNRLWWAPEGRGYTQDVDQAGRFTRAQAEHTCSHSEEKMWAEADVLAKARKVVWK